MILPLLIASALAALPTPPVDCPQVAPSQTTAWAEGTWDVKQGDKDWFTVLVRRAQFGVMVDILRYSDTSWRPLRVVSVCDAPRQTLVFVANDVETKEELRIALGAAPGGGLVGTVSGGDLPAPVGVTARAVR